MGENYIFSKFLTFFSNGNLFVTKKLGLQVHQKYFQVYVNNGYTGHILGPFLTK